MSSFNKWSNSARESEWDTAPPPYETLVDPLTSVEGTGTGSVDVEPELQLSVDYDKDPKTSDNLILATIKPSDGIKRRSVNICCVVDISGSMGETATFRDESGSLESDGLTILDLVKHAIKTIVSTMTDHDTLSIVSFSCRARVELSPKLMTISSKTEALTVLEGMREEGSTNLWGGLELGWHIVRKTSRDPNQVPCIFLFTDGMPNVVPPRGHLPMIKNFIDKHSLPCTVNTFGFGYSLDSVLLDAIARECDGNFMFIPDSSFVGTAFINATANLYTTLAQDVRLDVLSSKDALQVIGGHKSTPTTWGLSVRVGNVQFAQPKELVLLLPVTAKDRDRLEELEFSLTYKVMGQSSKVVKKTFRRPVEDKTAVVLRNVFRSRFVDSVAQTITEEPAENNRNGSAMGLVLSVVQSFAARLSEDLLTKSLLEDINGQVVEAYKLDYYSRWGKHYLLSLTAAHRNQLCNNFKDPGVQHYGSKLFSALRDNFDEIFNKLPPPKPTKTCEATRTGPVQMQMYNNSRGPCFHGESVVQMHDGQTKLVQEIMRGDMVKTALGDTKVLCVIKTFIKEGYAEMVRLNQDLVLTPYHPVYDGNGKKWKFPNDMARTETMPCDAVYNFVLEAEHTMIIGGIPCVTLGHGVRGDVRQHSYLGTEIVVQEMKANKHWGDGLLICKGLKRDVDTGLICGMQWEEEYGIAEVE